MEDLNGWTRIPLPYAPFLFYEAEVKAGAVVVEWRARQSPPTLGREPFQTQEAAKDLAAKLWHWRCAGRAAFEALALDAGGKEQVDREARALAMLERLLGDSRWLKPDLTLTVKDDMSITSEPADAPLTIKPGDVFHCFKG